MIEPAVDGDGRIQWVSLVPPLTADEYDALVAALKTWQNIPIVWTHGIPDVQITPLRFEPDIQDTP